MCFYNGAVSYDTLMWLPIPELLRLDKYAERLFKEQNSKIGNKYGR